MSPRRRRASPTAPITAGGVQAQPLNGSIAGTPQPGVTTGTTAAPPVYGSASGMGAAPGSEPPRVPACGAAAGAGIAAGADNSGAAAQPAFIWPVRGPILGTFDDAKNKGLNIGGVAGDPVNASADGRVVYSGNGLRGYGNLIIIKHDCDFSHGICT